MLSLHYVLVIATCAFQTWVFGSSIKESSVSKKQLEKGKGRLSMTSTGSDKTFSFEEFAEFAEFAKSKHEKGVEFKKMQTVLEFMITQTDTSNGPEEYMSIMKNWITGKRAVPSFSSANPTNTEKWDKKIEILRKASSRKQLNEDDKEILREWKRDSLAAARRTVHTIFLNGKPDDNTVKLFTSLESNHFAGVQSFLRNRNFSMKRICETISKMFFKPAIEFSSRYTHKEAYVEQYDCVVGNKRQSKLLHSIGLCEEEGNTDISYFRVAVAKAERKKDGSFQAQYFIAFDKIDETLEYCERNSFVWFEYKYHPQVAISFSAIYERKNEDVFSVDISSLRGEKLTKRMNSLK